MENVISDCKKLRLPYQPSIYEGAQGNFMTFFNIKREKKKIEKNKNNKTVSLSETKLIKYT